MALTKITANIIEDGAITSGHLASGAVTHSSLSSITTDNVSEGSTNLYFTNARADARIAAATTDDLTEGSTNLYFTNERVDDRVNALLTAGTGITLTYDDANNTLTVAGAAQYGDSDVESYLSGGTGVTFSSGVISIGQDVGTTATPTFGNITTTGYIAGPATFTIDPAAVGDNTGTVVIAGNLQVDGTTTTINSTTMTVDDLNITLASGAANAAAANGAGITVDGASATITYDGTNDEWDFNKDINVTGTVTSDGLTVDTTATNGVTIKASDNLTTNYPLLVQNNAGTGRLELSPYGINNNIDFKIQQGGVNRIFIESSNGNVGIGTSSPPHKLSVFGTGAGNATVQIEGEGGADPYINFLANNTQHWSVGIDDSDSDKFKISEHSGLGTNDYLVVDTSGNVGIGTTSPEKILHIKTSVNNTAFARIESTATNSYPTLSLKNDAREYQLTTHGGVSDSFVIYDGTAGANRLVINTSGNVGIGTASPSASLHVNSGTVNLASIFESTDVTTQVSFKDTNQESQILVTDGETRISADINNENASSALTFRIDNTEAMRIGSNGNTSIGTTGTNRKLTVTGSSTSQGTIYAYTNEIHTGTDTSAHVSIRSDNASASGDVLHVRGDGSGNLLTIDKSGTEKLVVDSSGNVGIGTGTDTPGAKLEIRDGNLWLNAASNGDPEIFFIDNDGPTGIAGVKIRYINSNGKLYFDHKYDNASSGFLFRNRVDGTALDTMALINGNVGIGITLPAVSLDVGSKTDAIRIPNGTTAQRPSSPSNGMIRYNTTENKVESYIDGSWYNITATSPFPVTSNLYARYTADDFTYNGTSTPPTLNDSSGNGRHITTTSTTTGGGFWLRSSTSWPSKVTNSANTNGASQGFSAIQFDTTEGLALPDASGISAYAASGFSFAYVARYSGANKLRIMDGFGSNNLIGAWGGSRGVSFDGSWIVGSGTQHSSDQTHWFIIVMRSSQITSKTTNNNSGNWVETGAVTHNYTNANYSASGRRYGLNGGNYGVNMNTEISDFELGEWCFWDKDLTDAEMDSVQGFLETKYGI